QIGFNSRPFDAPPNRRAIIAVAHIELTSVQEFQRPADTEQTPAGCGVGADDFSAFLLLHRGGEDFRTAGRSRADQDNEFALIIFLGALSGRRGGAPVPADKFTQTVAFAEEITRDLGDSGYEAAAVVP